MKSVLESSPPELRALVPTFERLGDGVAAFGRDGRIVYANPAHETLFGFAREELVGSLPPYPHWPERERQCWTDLFDRILRRGRSGSGVSLVPLDLVDARGELISVDCVWGPLLDEFEYPVVYVGLLHPRKSAHGNEVDPIHTDETQRRAKQMEMRGETPIATARARSLGALDRAILEHVLRGRGLREIAEETSLGVAALRGRLRSIFRKHGVRSQSDLLRAPGPDSTRTHSPS